MVVPGIMTWVKKCILGAAFRPHGITTEKITINNRPIRENDCRLVGNNAIVIHHLNRRDHPCGFLFAEKRSFTA